MSLEPVVVARGLSKRFKIYGGSLGRLADWLGVPPAPRYQEFWALRDVSFELRRGECLGIIGPNGAGKTTLLKLLTGVLSPTSGELQMRGRVLSLLELGSDFNPELTGRQNVVESMRLLGIARADDTPIMDEVEGFAELGEYFDRPVKMYSSGMFVRLAFSLFSTIEPELFLVDEALTVGDLRFSAKALGRIRDMRERGTTLLFVSHNLEVVTQLCTRVIWVQAGRVQLDGKPQEVTSAYIQFMIGAIDVPSSVQPAAKTPALPDTIERLWLGDGWYPLEAYAGEVFRWADAVAELVFDGSENERQLVLEVEPAPGGTTDHARPTTICVDDGLGLAAQFTVSGRTTIHIPVASSIAGASAQQAPQRIRLLMPEGAHRIPGDDRSLAFRVLRWGWAHTARMETIQSAQPWRDTGYDADLQHELRAVPRALAAHPPVRGARARLAHVVTRNAAGAPATRFQTGDEIVLEITAEALADVPKLIIGLEIKDAFARGLYRTRNDLQSDNLPSSMAGDRVTIRFRCARLVLGQGVYHFTVGVGGEGLENEIWQLVERAWSFQVLNTPESSPFGIVDLDWRYETERRDQTPGLADGGVPAAAEGT